MKNQKDEVFGSLTGSNQRDRTSRIESEEFESLLLHDMKNLLVGIMGTSRLLSEYKAIEDPEESKKLISLLEEESTRLKELVENLLLLSRDRSRCLNCNCSRVLLDEMVDCVMGSVKLLSYDKKIDLVRVYPADFQLYIDPVLFRHLLFNLLSNCHVYTPEGGRVTIKCQERENRHVLTIRDTGLGFSPSELSRCFQRFTRFDRPREELGCLDKGTGLGLYISHRIVEWHGGSITVDSPGTGRGSIFTIELPAGEY